MTLIDVHLTARSPIALETLAVEAAIRVHTLACMLTRIAIGHGTFIHIFCAVCPFIALWAGADVLSIQRVGVAQRSLVAWIADAGIIQMT